MRTYYIIKDKRFNCPTIVEGGWQRINKWLCSIGPYFSYKEAMNVLHVWSK